MGSIIKAYSWPLPRATYNVIIFSTHMRVEKTCPGRVSGIEDMMAVEDIMAVEGTMAIEAVTQSRLILAQ